MHGAPDSPEQFNEGLPAELPAELVTQFQTERAERYLLAFVYGHLGETAYVWMSNFFTSLQ